MEIIERIAEHGGGHIGVTRSICENTVMTITQGRDVIALYKSDIIALRDYLVQITPIL